ncbi:hypothetical protein [Candidatus Reidiella endopervernicosa]|uniref:Uncharacterized protein n=1 Tax=Candidatus Reidiella endopervernicosa TaxID=2738883 RepID=A0A6N0HSD5_9GAMM|nr:hypothetical protein [Candidatus Reidiella endopervernicosa]QKQ25305.1 hypothetical protein HUE57_02615 [Candidatus Reidiella endopervernicosa]
MRKFVRASKPLSKRKTSRDVYAAAPRQFLRSLRNHTLRGLYTAPSVTLRRHKAAAASSPSFARALKLRIGAASTIGD